MVIVDPISNKPTAAKSNPAKEEVPNSNNEESESDNEESVNGDLHTSSEEDKSNKEDNILSGMQRVFALVDSGLN